MRHTFTLYTFKSTTTEKSDPTMQTVFIPSVIMVRFCFVCATECWRVWIDNQYRDQLAVVSYGFSFRQEQQPRSDMYFGTPSDYRGSLSGDRAVDRKVCQPLPSRPKLRMCIYSPSYPPCLYVLPRHRKNILPLQEITAVFSTIPTH